MLTGCVSNNKNVGDKAKISVVATIFPLYDFAREIAGDLADVALLIPPGADAHNYDPTLKGALAVAEADLVICVGGVSDVWVERLLESNDINKIVILKLIGAVEPLDVADGDGHGHDEYDEHIWTSPVNAALMAEAITAALCGLDPENAAAYRAKCDKYTRELSTLDAEIRDIINNSAKKLLIVADSFPFLYFTHDYGLDWLAAIPGCGEHADPTAAAMAALIDAVNDNGATVIFHTERGPTAVTKTICEETGAEAVLLHSCQNVTRGEFESGETYLSLMRGNLENLAKGLN